MNADVLVIEDEQEIRDLISLQLKRAGYRVETCASAEEAMPLLDERVFDLALIDWMLPGASGLEVIETLQSRGKKTGIMMVTAKADPESLIEALESGADDYLAKPFDASVLRARAAAVVRRQQLPLAQQIGNVRFEAETETVYVDGVRILLTEAELKLLAALFGARGRVLTRSQLVDRIQGGAVNVVSRTVDTHVFTLRKKLGPAGDIIETIRGVGYRVKPE